MIGDRLLRQARHAIGEIQEKNAAMLAKMRARRSAVFRRWQNGVFAEAIRQANQERRARGLPPLTEEQINDLAEHADPRWGHK